MKETNTIHALAYFNLLKTGSWIEEQVKEALRPFNLTHAQLNALYILMENDPDTVYVHEIKDRILVSNPDVTRLLDRLVKKGYVERETCPENRRKVNISLTESGRDLFLKAQLSLRDELGDFFEAKISEDEAKELRRILHKIRE